ncbi:MAG: transcription antitermination factor NusB [Arcobacteraceae bacterium]|jgi:N utilization substance protein B|nr:transcription antitermination factor NusB [Arcobacteraceae bacterium]
MATRTQARESVVGLLYAYDLGNTTIAKFSDIIFEDKKIRNKQKEFAQDLFDGVIENLESIDVVLSEHLKQRDINEVGAVEKAILRLSIFEISFKKIDKAIAINEAIELAKRLASDNAPKFINGLLDSI